MPRPDRSHRDQGGSILIEVLIALTIVLLVLQMMSNMIVSSSRSRAIQVETASAARAARNLLERMRNEDFFELVARYDQDGGNDPDGPGSAPGAYFEIEGLRALPGEPAVGRIILPSILTATDPDVWELREDVEARDLGMPHDLNADGKIDDADHLADYVILPIQIEIRWTGKVGRREYRIYTMLSELRG